MDHMAFMVSSAVSDVEKNRRSALELNRLHVQANYHFLPATPRTSTEVICSSPIRFEIDEGTSPRSSYSGLSGSSGSSSFESDFSRRSTFTSMTSNTSSTTSSGGRRKKRRTVSFGWAWKIWSPLKHLQMSI